MVSKRVKKMYRSMKIIERYNSWIKKSKKSKLITFSILNNFHENSAKFISKIFHKALYIARPWACVEFVTPFLLALPIVFLYYIGNVYLKFNETV